MFIMQKTKEEKDFRRRLELRFIKSYKYKHKRLNNNNNNENNSLTNCDSQCHTMIKGEELYEATSLKSEIIEKRRRRRCRCRRRRKHYSIEISLKSLVAEVLIFSILTSYLTSTSIYAYCPSKCVCNDQLLSANCTQVSTISIVPMTLNPLLKHMTLNYLPIVELSNSLSVYRQLETLDLKSNQLKQISYQNFNFKPAPPPHSSIKIHHNNHNNALLKNNSFYNNKPSTNDLDYNNHNSNNEHLARHLKNSIERFAASLASSDTSAQEASSLSSNQAANNNNEVNNYSTDEIRFHLRVLDLSDNRIDQLGDGLLGEQDNNDFSPNNNNDNFSQTIKVLKSIDLERQAPFLTLTRLEFLNLSANKLKHLREHVFLGLINLKRLDLSKNQLEFVDKHAFVGLIELETLNLSSNKLAKHLNHLSASFCRAPMNELKHLDLSDNNNNDIQRSSLFSDNHNNNLMIMTPPAGGGATPFNDYDRDSILLLPNQMFLCASKLKSLKLVNLQLRYIQVSAFDNLLQLEYLNLSKNNLEQVPMESLNYYGSNLSKTLKYLDLSETLIEFVNFRTFQSLEMLQILEMNNMPMLVSFDLAAFNLKPTTKTIINQTNWLNSQLINEQLLELHLKNNKRLQSIHSSISINENKKLKFLNLKQLKLEGNVELRELALEKMLDLTQQTNVNTNNNILRIDLSYSNKLNCTSCQMNWLIESALNERNSLNIGANGNDNNKNSWLPIPNRQTMMMMMMFNNNNNPHSQEQSATTNHYYNQAQAVPLPLASIGGNKPASAIQVHLSDSALIGCAWPYSMPLAQLLDLNYNFGSILEQCKLTAAASNNYDEHAFGLQQQQQQQELPSISSHHSTPASNFDGLDSRSNSIITTNGDTDESTSSQPILYSVVVVIIMAGFLILMTKQLILYFRYQKRQTADEFHYKFNGSPTVQMMQNNNNNNNNNNNSGSSPGDCSTSSILSAADQANINHSAGPFLRHQDNSTQLMIFNENNNFAIDRKFVNVTSSPNRLLLSATNNNNNSKNGAYLNSHGLSGANRNGFSAGAVAGEIRGNLFSRFVNQLLTGSSWRRSSSSADSSTNTSSILTTTTADFIMGSQPINNLQRITASSSSSSSTVCAGQPSTNAAAAAAAAAAGVNKLLPPPTTSINSNEHVVYGGCLSDKILANNKQHQQPLYESADNNFLNGERGQFFAKPMSTRFNSIPANANNSNNQASTFLGHFGLESSRPIQGACAGGQLVYANCQQRLNESQYQYQYNQHQHRSHEPHKTLSGGLASLSNSSGADHNQHCFERLAAISCSPLVKQAGYETCQNGELETTTGNGLLRVEHSSGSAASYLAQNNSSHESPFNMRGAILSPNQTTTTTTMLANLTNNNNTSGNGSFNSSSFLVDGHIYVTLDGPIKQNVSNNNKDIEYYYAPATAATKTTTGYSVYEYERPAKQQLPESFAETNSRTMAEDGKGGGEGGERRKVFDNNKNNSSSSFLNNNNGNRNKILEQDYKSFEWPPSAVDFATSSKSGRSVSSQQHEKEEQNNDDFLSASPLKNKTPSYSSSQAFSGEGAHSSADAILERNKFKLANKGNNNDDNRKWNENCIESTRIVSATHLNGEEAEAAEVRNILERQQQRQNVYMGAQMCAKLSSAKPSSSSPPSIEEMEINVSSFRQQKSKKMLFLNSTMNENSNRGRANNESNSDVIDRSLKKANNLELFSPKLAANSKKPRNNNNNSQLLPSMDKNPNLNGCSSANSNNITIIDTTAKLKSCALVNGNSSDKQRWKEERNKLLQNNRNKYDDANDDAHEKNSSNSTTTDDNDYVINGLRQTTNMETNNNNSSSIEQQLASMNHGKRKSIEGKLNNRHKQQTANAQGETTRRFFNGGGGGGGAAPTKGVTEGDAPATTTTAADVVANDERRRRGKKSRVREQEVVEEKNISNGGINITGKEFTGSNGSVSISGSGSGIDMIGQRNFSCSNSSVTSSSSPSYALRPQSHHLVVSTSSNRDYVDSGTATERSHWQRQLKEQNCDLTTKDFKLTPALANTINGNYEISQQQQNITDFRRRTTTATATLVGGNNNSNGIGKSSQNEIYSNQFYYCKPQSTATLSRNQNNNNNNSELK